MTNLTDKSATSANEAKVKKEINRLNRIYKDIPDNKKKLVQGLIVQAARLRISLDDLWADIETGGDTELFSQSEKTEPYERERPSARLFNSRDKNYQSIIKLLCDQLPSEDSTQASDEILNFITKPKGKK